MFLCMYVSEVGGRVSTSLPLAANSGRLTWVRQKPHVRPALPISISVCAQTLIHSIGNGAGRRGGGGCTDTVSESVLKVHSGRQIPCRIGLSNRWQYYAWPLSQTLYRLIYPAPVLK